MNEQLSQDNNQETQYPHSAQETESERSSSENFDQSLPSPQTFNQQPLEHDDIDTTYVSEGMINSSEGMI